MREDTRRFIHKLGVLAACAASLLCFCHQEAIARTSGTEAQQEPPASDRQLLKLVELQKHGVYVAADQGFRLLFESTRRGNEDQLGILLSRWKSGAVAGRSFVEDVKRGTAEAARYQKWGEALLRQGLASLAAVELERAAVLGDGSPKMYSALLECYRQAGEKKNFDRVLALARADRRAAKRISKTAKGFPARPPQGASPKLLTYPDWVAWSLPIHASGGLFVGPVWVSGRLVYPYAKKVPGAVRAVDPIGGHIYWEYDLNPDYPSFEFMTTPGASWQEKSPLGLQADGDRVLLRYAAYSMTAPKTPKSGNIVGSILGSGMFTIDSASGAVLNNLYIAGRPESPPEEPCKDAAGLSLSRRCLRALAEGNSVFVLFDDLKLSKITKADSKVVWALQMDEATKVPLVRKGDWLLVPGASRQLSAVDASTGKLSWQFPIATTAPIDASGPDIIVLTGQGSKILGLQVPRDLEGRRKKILKVAQIQLDAGLAQEILLGLIDADATDRAAYAALAARAEGRTMLPAVKDALARLAMLGLKPDEKDGRVQETVRASTTVRWTARIGSERVDELVSDASRVYLLAPKTLLAVDRGNGAEVWRLDLPVSEGRHPHGDGHGLSMGDGKLFLSSRGKILAVEGSTGKVLWTQDVSVPGSRWSTLMSPAYADGKVFAGIMDKTGGLFQAHLVALDAASGRSVWTSIPPTGSPHWAVGGTNFIEKPVVHDGLVYFPTRMGRLFAVREDSGKVEWSFATAVSTQSRSPDVGQPIATQENVAFLAADGWLRSLDAKTGKLIWERNVSPETDGWAPFDTLTDVGGRLCHSAQNAGWTLQCRDAATGAVIWSQDGFTFQRRPAVLRGSLWVPRRQDLAAVDPQTGTIRKQEPIPAIRQFDRIEADDKYLYILHSDGVTQVQPFIWAD